MRGRPWSYYLVTYDDGGTEVVKGKGKRHVKDVLCADDEPVHKVEILNRQRIAYYLVTKGLEERNIRML